MTSVDPGNEWLTIEQAADLVTGGNQFRENFDYFGRWLGHAMRNVVRAAVSDGKLMLAPTPAAKFSSRARRSRASSRARRASITCARC